MERTDGNRISKAEYFELREKRLKLVYRILYVIVAIWIAVILNISNDGLTKDIVPAYAFLLAISSLMIIKIIKYALMEFRCMKVVGGVDEDVLKQTEDRYDNIWRSFGVQLAFAAELMIFNIIVPVIFSEAVSPWIIVVCVSYFLTVSLVGFFKKITSSLALKILDTIAIFVGTITAYAVCCLVCLVAI